MQYILKTKSNFTLLTTEYILNVFDFNQILFVAFPWVITSTGPGGFMICVLILGRELPKAKPKVVLWRSRESNKT